MVKSFFRYRVLRQLYRFGESLKNSLNFMMLVVPSALMLIAFAPSENDLKKCKNISVGIFQPFHV
jgi:hypothetical protein